MSKAALFVLLLQAVDSVHQTLELRAVNQVEGVFLAGEHRESRAARGGDHGRGFFGRQIAGGNRIQCQVNQDSQAADAAAFLVDFRLRRFTSGIVSRDRGRLHKYEYGRRGENAQ